jgi:hypothetical protein
MNNSILVTQIEACLNYQPLTALSNDPSYLSPGNFLTGIPLMSLPEPDFTKAAMKFVQMAAGSALQSAVVEEVVI